MNGWGTKKTQAINVALSEQTTEEYLNNNNNNSNDADRNTSNSENRFVAHRIHCVFVLFHVIFFFLFRQVVAVVACMIYVNVLSLFRISSMVGVVLWFFNIAVFRFLLLIAFRAFRFIQIGKKMAFGLGIIFISLRGDWIVAGSWLPLQTAKIVRFFVVAHLASYASYTIHTSAIFNGWIIRCH